MYHYSISYMYTLSVITTFLNINSFYIISISHLELSVCVHNINHTIIKVKINKSLFYVSDKSLPFIIFVYNNNINNFNNSNILNQSLFHNTKRIFSIKMNNNTVIKNFKNSGYILLIFGNNNNGVYSILKNIKSKYIYTHHYNNYIMRLNNKKIKLPFILYLKNFINEVYPGTKIAKNYIAFMNIDNIMAKWNIILKINKPFRYKGYTFYQTSFFEDAETNLVSFSINKNLCFVTPYFFFVNLFFSMIFIIYIKLKKEIR